MLTMYLAPAFVHQEKSAARAEISRLRKHSSDAANRCSRRRQCHPAQVGYGGHSVDHVHLFRFFFFLILLSGGPAAGRDTKGIRKAFKGLRRTFFSHVQIFEGTEKSDGMGKIPL
jgi:hypothetical protein